MTEPPFSLPLEDTVVIVGVGLIGGSLAAAIKQRKLARHVIGVGRDQARMKAAQQAGLIDEGVTSLASVVTRADLMVFCTPVGQVETDVRKAEEVFSQAAGTSHGEANLLLTDVGSVKGPICNGLADVERFIGSHPIAGSHRQGFEAANASLFDGRVCVITPLLSAPKGHVERLERFWRAVGMQTIQMSPEAHDLSLAMTSHLPHLIAAALATTLEDKDRPLTGSGFRDTTRIAAGSPDLWTDILLNNAEFVVRGIDQMQQKLASFREALQDRNADAIRELLIQGQKIRSRLDSQSPTVDRNPSDSME